MLVTNQNKALVEYAIADSDQQLFVSKYLIKLPSEEELIAEIERENNVLREQGVVYGREEWKKQTSPTSADIDQYDLHAPF